MRVLLISPDMGYGGAERVVIALMHQLPFHDAEVALAAPPGALDAGLPPATIRFVLDPAGRSPLGVVRTTVGITRALRRHRPDVVHAHNPKASLASGLALRLLPGPRPPLVATFHGVAEREYAAATRMLRLADHVACVSEDTRDHLIAAGAEPARLSVIENGVSPPPRPYPPEERGGRPGPVVTAVGRLVAQKAHDRFLHMAAALGARDSDARFLLVGDGPLRPELERLSARLGLEDRVSFLGQRADAREIIGRSDLVVFSSEWEGLSIAALEALAAGVPVVSTPVHGMRVLEASGAASIAAEPTADALAASVHALLEDDGARRRMGTAGRALIAARFSWERMAAEYAALYTRVRTG